MEVSRTGKNYLVESQKEIEFDEVHLIEEGLPFCIGCSNCFRVGHEKCPHYNVIGKIIEKIETADGIIIATTTYNMRETALLKIYLTIFALCFIDHTFSKVRRWLLLLQVGLVDMRLLKVLKEHCWELDLIVAIRSLGHLLVGMHMYQTTRL